MSNPDAPWPVYSPAAEQRVIDLIRNGQVYDYAGRAPVTELEEEFSRLHDGAHAVSFNSGTSALFALLGALGLGDGDEVLVPNLTFLASASPLLWLGGRPVLVDSHPEEPSIGPTAILSVLSARTKAVIVTHLFGNPVDAVRIADICKTRGIILIEDCSHAHASRIGQQHVGTFGDAAIYSIGGGKMVSGGHGGLLLTRNSVVRDIALLIGHFKPRSRTDLLNSDLHAYAEYALGGNLRLSPIAAALALDHLRDLNRLSRGRQINVDILAEAFDGLLERVQTPEPRMNATHFDIVFRLPEAIPSTTRDKLLSALADADVAATAPSTRPLNRVLRSIAATGQSRDNTYLERLVEFALSVPDDDGLPHSTIQHDRMISFPAGLLFRADGTYATELARKARPVLECIIGEHA
jgi:dTDP-4-amino-4,6-dideoxygalactose transaminase